MAWGRLLTFAEDVQEFFSWVRDSETLPTSDDIALWLPRCQTKARLACELATNRADQLHEAGDGDAQALRAFASWLKTGPRAWLKELRNAYAEEGLRKTRLDLERKLAERPELLGSSADIDARYEARLISPPAVL